MLKASFVADIKNNTIIGKNIPDGRWLVTLDKRESAFHSVQQNALLWKIIRAICEKEDGDTSQIYETYSNLLEMAGTPYEDIYIKEVALDFVKQMNKHVKVVNRYTHNGESWVYCWVFKGLSEMNTQEAHRLIQSAKVYATKVGVKLDESLWRYLDGEQ